MMNDSEDEHTSLTSKRWLFEPQDYSLVSHDSGTCMSQTFVSIVIPNFEEQERVLVAEDNIDD